MVIRAESNGLPRETPEVCREFAGEGRRGQTGTGWLSGTTSATDRNVIVGRIRTHLEIALDPMKTVDQARSAVIGAKAECAIYEISVPTVAATPKK